MMHPRPSTHAAYAILVDAMWAGEVSEREFIADGLALGIPLTALNQVLEELREHDGTLEIGASA